MSQENVDLVKAVHPPSGSDLTQMFRDESGLEPLRSAAPVFDPEVQVIGGDMAGLSVNAGGLDGLIEAWREWLEPWESYWTEVEDFIDAGDDRVVVLVRDHGRLRAAASEVENLGGSVWSVRRGKIVRIEFHAHRDAALEAAGLRG
jgi:ketosteroid isomerase-like protein